MGWEDEMREEKPKTAADFFVEAHGNKQAVTMIAGDKTVGRIGAASTSDSIIFHYMEEEEWRDVPQKALVQLRNVWVIHASPEETIIGDPALNIDANMALARARRAETANHEIPKRHEGEVVTLTLAKPDSELS